MAARIGTNSTATPPTETIPDALRADLVGFRTELPGVLAGSGQKFPAEKLDLGVAYPMMTLWAQLYGHVTLEVFGNCPIPVTDPDGLFEAVSADLVCSGGLSADRTAPTGIDTVGPHDRGEM